MWFFFRAAGEGFFLPSAWICFFVGLAVLLFWPFLDLLVVY